MELYNHTHTMKNSSPFNKNITEGMRCNVIGKTNVNKDGGAHEKFAREFKHTEIN